MSSDPPPPAGLDSGLLVYATLAGLAGFVPLPLVDRALARRVAVGAVRRVAARHQVVVEPAAARLLARQGKRKRWLQIPDVVRAVLARFVPGLEVGTRLEDGLRTFCTAALLERYLRVRPERWSGPLGVDEAAVIRRAIDLALPDGALAAVRAAPAGASGRVREAARPAGSLMERADRIVDGLLEAIADAPAALGDKVEEAFDVAVREAAR